MTRDETVQTGWNMFSGENITNWKGVVVPGVEGISFPVLTRDTPWEVVAAGSAPAMASARFTIQMYVERNQGTTSISAAGSYDFFAVSRDTVLQDGAATQYYQLINMIAVNPGGKISETVSWGGVNLTYLTNEAPQAVLEVSDVGGSPLPMFRCDASGSSDVDSGLHQEPYRWQFSSGGIWSNWNEDPIANTTYPMPGDYTISVQVRDRWGLTGAAEQDVHVSIPPPPLGLPFPGSPYQLMANFQTIYETRDFDEYRKLMHPDFLTILQDETIMEFPDVGTTLDVAEEERIHERMFSGEAVTDTKGYLVPGVLNIDFRVFRALDDWTMSPVGDLFPEAERAPFEVDFMFDRGQSYSTLKVNGTIKFYVTSRDSLHEGIDRQYYQMIGQVDLTGFKAIETTSWGTVKALFR